MLRTSTARILTALSLCIFCTAAIAQQPDPGAAAGENSGRPGDGYFVTAVLAGLALFLIAKSARR